MAGTVSFFFPTSGGGGKLMRFERKQGRWCRILAVRTPHPLPAPSLNKLQVTVHTRKHSCLLPALVTSSQTLSSSSSSCPSSCVSTSRCERTWDTLPPALGSNSPEQKDPNRIPLLARDLCHAGFNHAHAIRHPQPLPAAVEDASTSPPPFLPPRKVLADCENSLQTLR